MWCWPFILKICCMYVTHEVIQSNRDEATEQTGPKLQDDPSDLDLWPFILKMVCDTMPPLPLMCCMYATYEVIFIYIWSNMEEATEQTRLKLWKTCVTLTFHPENGAQQFVPSCFVCTPHTCIKWFSQIGTKPQSGQSQNLKWPVWPWPFVLKMEHDTSSWCVVCIAHIKLFGISKMLEPSLRVVVLGWHALLPINSYRVDEWATLAGPVMHLSHILQRAT